MTKAIEKMGYNVNEIKCENKGRYIHCYASKTLLIGVWDTKKNKWA